MVRLTVTKPRSRSRSLQSRPAISPTRSPENPASTPAAWTCRPRARTTVLAISAMLHTGRVLGRRAGGFLTRSAGFTTSSSSSSAQLKAVLSMAWWWATVVSASGFLFLLPRIFAA